MSSLLNRSQLQTKANLIMESPMNIVNTLYNGWEYAFNLLHGAPSDRPELLEIIGTNGVELFQLNQVLTNFMITQLSGTRNDIVENIQQRLLTLPDFIYNQDGTVTEVVVVPPSASTIVYGQTLGSSVLSGGSSTIPGTFMFKTPDVIPNAGTTSYIVEFIPNDNVTFKTQSYDVNVVVQPVNLPNVTFTPPESLAYDGTPKAFQVSVDGLTDIVIQYEGRNQTWYSDSEPPRNEGDYTITVATTNTNYAGSQSYDFTITPAITATPELSGQ